MKSWVLYFFVCVCVGMEPEDTASTLKTEGMSNEDFFNSVREHDWKYRRSIPFRLPSREEIVRELHSQRDKYLIVLDEIIKKKMKSWVLFPVLTIGILIAACGSLMLILGIQWSNDAYNVWTAISTQTINNTAIIVDNHIRFIKFSAYTITQVKDRTDQYHMSQMFTSFTLKSGYNLGSFGFMERQLPTGKLSWQIAAGFGCPTLIWAYCDNATWPQFHGYCVNYDGSYYLDSKLDYNGTDTGFKPYELELLNGQRADVFLPVFDLLGQTTLTYEMAFNGNTMIAFAEINLKTLSSYLARYASVSVVVVDTASGNVTASNVPGLLKFPTNVANGTTVNGTVWWSQRYIDNTLDWTIYSGVPYATIYEQIRYTIIASIIGCVVLVVVAGIAMFLVTYCCITRQIQKSNYNLLTDLMPPASIHIDDRQSIPDL